MWSRVYVGLGGREGGREEKDGGRESRGKRTMNGKMEGEKEGGWEGEKYGKE